MASESVMASATTASTDEAPVYTEPFRPKKGDQSSLAPLNSEPVRTEAFSRQGAIAPFNAELEKSSQDKLVAEVEGVVLSVGTNSVAVKLAEATVANFPLVLFSDPALASMGQPVHYQILESGQGIKYQRISARANQTPPTEDQIEISNLLAGLKLSR